MPRRGAVGALLLVMGLYAAVNLLWVPEVITGRVSAAIASAVNGSVRSGREWEVPR
jgi:hypothetical protein